MKKHLIRDELKTTEAIIRQFIRISVKDERRQLTTQIDFDVLFPMRHTFVLYFLDDPSSYDIRKFSADNIIL